MLSKDNRAELDERLSAELTTIVSVLLSSYDEYIAKKTEEFFSEYPEGSLDDITRIDEEIYLAQMLEEFIADIPQYISLISRNYSIQFSDEL